MFTTFELVDNIDFDTLSFMTQHGKDSDKPLPYSHLDIAGSSGPFPGVPTGAPIVALAAQFVFPRC